MDFLLIQQQIERSDDHIRSLPQLLGEVALADHHISGRELFVNSTCIGRNSLCECPEFFCRLSSRRFAFASSGSNAMMLTVTRPRAAPRTVTKKSEEIAVGKAVTERIKADVSL